MLFSHLYLRRPSCLFPAGLPAITLYSFFYSPTFPAVLQVSFHFSFCILSQCPFSFYGSIALVDLDVLVVGVSRLHSDTPQSVRLLWTRDRPVGRPLTDNTQHSQETDIHAPGVMRTLNPSKRAYRRPIKCPVVRKINHKGI